MASLEGTWDGEFGYPSGVAPITPFVAEIVDTSGQLSGNIIEPNFVHGGHIQAALVGDVAIGRVSFTKSYGSGQIELYEELVHYEGVISEDETVISGSWTLLTMRGWFEMRREPPFRIPVKSEVSASVD